MAGPRIIISFPFIRELNLHRSKEQLEKEFGALEENTSEFAEFASRFNKDLSKYLMQYGGTRTADMPTVLYIVLRDRGLSFPEPVTVVYDENQKLMLVRYVNLLAQRLFPVAEQAALLTKYICAKLPLNLEREVQELQAEQHILMPLNYDLEEKPLKKWLK